MPVYAILKPDRKRPLRKQYSLSVQKTRHSINTRFHILSTRHLDSALLQKAKNAGIVADIVPFIEVQQLSTEMVEARLKSLGKERITAVFTSRNSVAAVGTFLRQPPGWEIACLNGATLEAVLGLWDKRAVRITAADARALATALVSATEPGKCIFFCGDRRMNTLPGILKEHSIAFEEVVVYRTIATPVFLQQDYEGILFFSKSAVDSFFSVNRVGPTAVLFSIGETTAKAIRKYCNNKILISAESTAEALMQRVIQFTHDK